MFPETGTRSPAARPAADEVATWIGASDDGPAAPDRFDTPARPSVNRHASVAVAV
jgi:hypothetical protein